VEQAQAQIAGDFVPTNQRSPENKKLIAHLPSMLMTRVITFKSLLLFLAILFLVLSFPMQVYAGNPYPSLLPYPLIGLVVLTTLLVRQSGVTAPVNPPATSGIVIMVTIYIFLLLLHTSWQTVANEISIEDAMSALVVYLFPVSFYGYFRRVATEREISWVLAAMIVAGVVVGAYYVYDSYVKLALGTVNDYALAAFHYSLERSNQTMEDVNRARISLGYRSYGLLQAPSVSATWVMLATFAALVRVPLERRVLRQMIVVLCGATLLMALNFTSIVAFAIIMLLFEFGGFSVFPSRHSATFGKLVSFAFFVALLFGAVLWVAGDAMLDFVLENFSYARDLVFGTGNLGMSMGGLVKDIAEMYMQHISDFPFTLLLGDGFSTFGMPKGGDIGFIESLARFGVPFFLVALIGFLVLIVKGLAYIRHVRNMPQRDELELKRAARIQFAVCIFLLVLITEGHYSIWVAKAVLPILFFALALYERYLTVPAQNFQAEHSAAVSPIPVSNP
jgi:hypothetical protein